MNDFVFSYPTKVYFGDGAAQRALESELGHYGRRVMLCRGLRSAEESGVYAAIHAMLIAQGKEVIDFPGIMPNPTYAKVQQGAALARESGADFILALGGGSVIDCCKVIAAQAKLGEDIWDMENLHHRFPTKAIPVGAVVTASGTGAEMNGGAVITHEEKLWKGGIFAFAPVFAALDANYTLTVPRMQVFSGAFDTLSHAMETYFGTSDADNVSDDVALAVMRSTVVNIRRLLRDINDIQARRNLMWDSAMAENGILKLGRVTDFQAHQIEHQLGAYTDCNHGQGLAVIQPAYYRHILKDAEEKFSRLARVVFDAEDAPSGLAALEGLIEACALPTRLGQLSSRVPITPALLREVADSTNIIRTGPRTLDNDEIYAILLECL